MIQQTLLSAVLFVLLHCTHDNDEDKSLLVLATEI